jgi:hypothetical protein
MENQINKSDNIKINWKQGEFAQPKITNRVTNQKEISSTMKKPVQIKDKEKASNMDESNSAKNSHAKQIELYVPQTE